VTSRGWSTKPAARHDGVDRHLFDRAFDEVGRHCGDDLVGRARAAREHGQHALLGRWHDGQAVGPAAREDRLVLVLETGELDAARAESRAREADL